MKGLLVMYLYICAVSNTPSGIAKKLDHGRFKRFLIYPRQAPTRYQFITGIGIPADLTYESLVIGYVLKAMYYLPFNATVYRENPFFPEYPADTYLDQRKISSTPGYSTLRWAIYKFISDSLDSFGYNGRECMFKAICEANEMTFDRHHSVFGELVHIFLRPSSSNDLSSDLTVDYFEAEKVGRNDETSCALYNCKLSLLSLISNVIKF